MVKKINRKLIGAFVMVAMLILSVSIVLFGSGDMFKERVEFVLYFDDSIKGLNTGAPVLSKGVRTGAVTQIVVRTIMEDLSSTVAVFIEIYPETFDVVSSHEAPLNPLDSLSRLIEKGLRAQLVSQSLVTGQLAVEFVMRPEVTYEMKNLDKDIPEIPTIPSTLTMLQRQLQQIDIAEMYTRLLSVLERIDSSLKNLNLEDTGSELNNLMTDIRKLVNTIDAETTLLATNLNQVANSSAEILVELQPEIKPLASKAGETLVAMGDLARTLESEVNPLAGATADALDAATEAIVQVNALLDSTAPTHDNLDRALEELTRAARSFRELTDYLERHPDALLRGKGYKDF